MDDNSDILTVSAADDYLLALQLQEEFNKENHFHDLPEHQFSAVDSRELKIISSSKTNERSTSVTDNSWELIDPNPDARELFVEFNRKYFWDKLNGVEVRWSSRMTLSVFATVTISYR